MPCLYCDCETFSTINLSRAGVYKYAEMVEILLFAYAFEDGPVSVWDVKSGAQCPADLRTWWNDPSVTLVFHNSMFDRTVINASGILPRIPASRYLDTMVWAMAHSLPGGLGVLCDILGVPSESAKQKEGRQLVLLFCKPTNFSHELDRADFKTGAEFKAAVDKLKARWPGRATPQTHPKAWAKFTEYVAHDILAMREVAKRLPKINYPFNKAEYQLWLLDQAMNDRGIPIDRRLVACAVAEADKARAHYGGQVYDATEGTVESANQAAAMLRYMLDSYGVSLPDMQAATLEARLNDESLPQEVKDLIAIRLEASLTSVSKYSKLMDAVNSDGRLRGCIQFCGATRTSRDAGRVFQPQNLARPTMKADEIEEAIQHIYDGDLLDNYDNPMKVLSNAIRGTIIAPPGRKFCIADLSNIEGRGQAWIAGEVWKIKAFFDFDTITGYDEKGKAIRLGFDLYILAYSAAFGVPALQVTDYQRQIGKVMELALGYGGGVGAFATFARAYRIDLDELAEKVWSTLSERIVAEATRNLARAKLNKRPVDNLREKTWVVCEALKLMWREAHPNISAMWIELEDAAKSAIINRGQPFHIGGDKGVSLATTKSGDWLFMRAPSGTCLCYPLPQIDDNGQITYMGMNQYSRKWSRLKTYGGKLFENLCQKIARDVLFYNKFEIENAGYHIVLPVHDELITEVPDNDEYSHKHLSAMMAANKPWSAGMPLAAAGFDAYRYRK